MKTINILFFLVEDIISRSQYKTSVGIGNSIKQRNYLQQSGVVLWIVVIVAVAYLAVVLDRLSALFP